MNRRDRKGKDREDDGRYPGLPRQGLDLAEELEALPDQAADLLEDLGQVAAALPLDDHGQDEKFQIGAVEAFGHVAEGFLIAQAEVDLVERLAELGPGRVGKFHGHHLEAAREGVPRLEGPGDHVEGVGELPLEIPEPATSS